MRMGCLQRTGSHLPNVFPAKQAGIMGLVDRFGTGPGESHAHGFSWGVAFSGSTSEL